MPTHRGLSRCARRFFLTICTFVVVFSACRPAFAQLTAEVLASGFTMPVAVVADPLAPDSFLVVQQDGLVRVVRQGVIEPTPFLDLRAHVTAGGESGLLGLAVAPEAGSRRVFVNFTNRDGHTVVARFLRTADPLVADTSTRFDLRWSNGQRFITQPAANHHGGHLAFGPDGYLYIGLGDGGGPSPDPDNSAQRPTTALGKMLRIDVNVPDDDQTGYRVPPDNPFVIYPASMVLHEIWAFGFRNPWRYSFDDVGAGATGALLIGDVGQDEREEIDYEPAGRGGRNYGWRAREGTIATPGLPSAQPAYVPLTNPLVDYGRDIGGSITGGFVYRGARLAPLFHGRYFAADFVSRRLFSVGLAVGAAGEAHVVDALEHTSELGDIGRVLTFGRDLAGELYLASTNGNVYRITPLLPPPAPLALSSVVNGATVRLAWEPGVGGGPVSSYRLDVGSQPGASDLLQVPMSTSAFDAVNVPRGVYYVRVRSVNAAAVSDASKEVTVIVGCQAPPPPPAGLTAQVVGQHVTVSWEAPAGATSHLVDVGSASALTDIAVIPTVAPGLAGPVAPGTYFVRVRALNECGAGLPSTEIAVAVPQ